MVKMTNNETTSIGPKTFETRFGSKGDCDQHLAELKWVEGYDRRRCKAIK
jgi:hypothetical protein